MHEIIAILCFAYASFCATITDLSIDMAEILVIFLSLLLAVFF